MMAVWIDCKLEVVYNVSNANCMFAVDEFYVKL